jgi:uncharacterized membrane protein YtjA (UPF0391 family)
VYADEDIAGAGGRSVWNRTQRRVSKTCFDPCLLCRRGFQIGAGTNEHRSMLSAKSLGEVAMTLLKWALLFFVISIVAGILGFTGLSAASADIARVLFYIFLVIFLVLLLLGLTIFRV